MRSLLTVRRALLVTTLVALVPALLIIIATGLEHGHQLAEGVREQARITVENVAAAHEEAVASLRRTMETMTALSGFYGASTEDRASALQAVLERNPYLVSLALVDEEGVVVTSTGLASGTDLSDRAHVRTALALGRFVVGEFVVARAGGDFALPFVAPIQGFGGQTTGALTAVYSLEAYGELFSSLQLPEEAVLGITDRSGHRLFFRPFKDTNPVGRPIAQNVWTRLQQGPDSGTITEPGSDGRRRFYSYRRLFLPGDDEPYIYVVVGYPESLAALPARRILLRNLALMGLVVAAAILVAVFLGRAVIGRRFEQLATTAGAISRGNMDARTGIPVDDSEISLVARAIDHMAGELEARTRERIAERSRIVESLQEKELLLKEVHHRVKNNLQLILSIMSLQRRSATTLDEFSVELETRINAIATVHEMLYESADLAAVPMQDLLFRLTGPSIPPQRIGRTGVCAHEVALRLESAVPVALIASELLTNAGKYGASEDGRIYVDMYLGLVAGSVELRVQDEGPGLPAGTATDGGDTLGLRLVGALAAQLRGTVSFGTAGGRGTCVVVRFPGDGVAQS